MKDTTSAWLNRHNPIPTCNKHYVLARKLCKPGQEPILASGQGGWLCSLCDAPKAARAKAIAVFQSPVLRGVAYISPKSGSRIYRPATLIEKVSYFIRSMITRLRNRHK